MTSPVVITRIQNRRGTQDQFDALYPPGYAGIGGCDINIWTRILLPGELAECTDTRRVFIGNLNGEYFELGAIDSIPPLILNLPPESTFTGIPQLTYVAQPFFKLIYSIVDITGADAFSPGENFTKSGEMQIVSVQNSPLPPPPDTSLPMPIVLPIPQHATLSDNGTEISTYGAGIDINFNAEYSEIDNTVSISYMHNFPSSLTFSTRSIIWSSF